MNHKKFMDIERIKENINCQKEEPETTAKIENFGKVANSICMSIVRKFI